MTLVKNFVANCERHQLGVSDDAIGIIPFMVPYVSLDDIQELDTQINTLNSDILALPIPLRENYATHEEYLKDWDKNFQIRRFTTFNSEWKQWVFTHRSLLARSGDDAVGEFESYKSQYNAWLQRYNSLFPSTPSAATKVKEEKKGNDITGAVKFASVAAIAVVGFLIYREAKK